jgi:hypothetical protein
MARTPAATRKTRSKTTLAKRSRTADESVGSSIPVTAVVDKAAAGSTATDETVVG